MVNVYHCSLSPSTFLNNKFFSIFEKLEAGKACFCFLFRIVFSLGLLYSLVDEMASKLKIRSGVDSEQRFSFFGKGIFLATLFLLVQVSAGSLVEVRFLRKF